MNDFYMSEKSSSHYQVLLHQAQTAEADEIFLRVGPSKLISSKSSRVEV